VVDIRIDAAFCGPAVPAGTEAMAELGGATTGVVEVDTVGVGCCSRTLPPSGTCTRAVSFPSLSRTTNQIPKHSKQPPAAAAIHNPGPFLRGGLRAAFVRIGDAVGGAYEAGSYEGGAKGGGGA
jgi:hypothetical protein